MKFLDLCAGIGGFSLGLERAGMTCAGQVEIEPFCITLLEKHWPHVPRWKDIKNEHEYHEYPAVDLVCGGYPCQPFSHAGKRRGTEDDRHLWPYVFRIVSRVRPAWCLFENVAGHISLGLDTVLADLESEGYQTGPLVIPACAVDAPHRRDRVWILAHTDRPGRQERDPTAVTTGQGFDPRLSAPAVLPDADDRRSPLRGDGEFPATPEAAGRGDYLGSGTEEPCFTEWPDESGLDRVADGVPHRVDRIRALGNAVVPPLVEAIGRAIMKAHYV